MQTKERITMTPGETIKAGNLLIQFCKPIDEDSGLYVYDEGWSDKEIALQVSPRISADHIHRLRSTILGKLAPPTTKKVNHTLNAQAWTILSDLVNKHNALCDELNVPQHKIPQNH